MLKTFADDLKATRMDNNISLRDVAGKTRLNIAVLESLEEGDYSFQPQAYIRAFLKEYISAIGLDSEEVLFDYDLARSGKYKSKRQGIPPKSEDIHENEVPFVSLQDEPEDIKLTNTKKLKDDPESTKHKIPEYNEIKNEVTNKTESVKSVIPDKTSNEKKEIQFVKIKNKFFANNPDSNSIKSTSSVKSVNNKNSFAFLNSPLIRNILMVLAGLLVLAGLYSLVNIIFFEGSKKNPDVIRQNFDDVVNEQERKILGKRSPEEIQDSIKKAEENLASLKDTITLKITATSQGIIYLVTDSVNYNKPDKIEYNKGEVGVFKANKSFFISSTNTESFKATLGDKPIKFNNISVSKVKITKDGVKSN